MAASESIGRALAQAIAAGLDAVVATAVRVDGRPPSRPGAKVLVVEGRLTAGTLGCSEFDSAAVEAARAVSAGGGPVMRTFRHDLGSIDVFLEPVELPPRLVIGGESPVGEALAELAETAGFEVDPEAVEDRGGEVYAVHVDHDDPGVAAFLEPLLRRRPAPRFIGVVGSRRHTGHHLDALARRGFTPDQLARINSPVGLDLGAQTPAEIAVSILAGLIAVRRGAEVRWLDPPR